MVTRKEDDNDKENQSTQKLVEKMIQQLIPGIIERIVSETNSNRKDENENVTSRVNNRFSKLVGPFAGSQDGYDFLCTAEAMFLTLDIKEHDKVKCLCSTFTGSAARWLLTHEVARSLNWNEFKLEFEKQFCARNGGRTDLMRLMQLKKKGNMEEHVAACRLLRRGIPQEIPEKELIFIFIQTLEEEEQAAFTCIDPTSLDDAFQKALRLSMFREQRNQPSCRYQAFDDHSHTRNYAPAARHQCSVTQRTQRRGYSERGPQCYNCHQYGHISRNCTERNTYREWRYNKSDARQRTGNQNNWQKEPQQRRTAMRTQFQDPDNEQTDMGEDQDFPVDPHCSANDQ